MVTTLARFKARRDVRGVPQSLESMAVRMSECGAELGFPEQD
jgi:hypothetical protein